jgi:uncharacterized phage protein gp47/JayE
MAISDLVYIDSTGYHYADYPTFLAYVQNEYRGIYGADIYLEPDSQDGQFLAIMARGFYDAAALGGSVYGSFSPASAQGVGLSRVVKINGISRKIPTKSTVDVTIVGTATTEIAGGVVIDTLNQKWDLPSSVIIPGGGEITVTATAQVEGNLSAAINTVTGIFTPTQGWQTVTNPTIAVPGQAVETDAELRARQVVSVALPALTVLDATVGALYNLTGVTEVRPYENDTGSADSNGVPAHSVEMIVSGGTISEIAQTIAFKKTPGTGTAGDISTVVYDSRGVPATIKFSRPTDVPIKVRITLAAKVGWVSATYEPLIAAAVKAVADGFGIGNNVLITKLYQPAYLPGAAGQTYDLTSIEIAKVPDAFGTVNIPITYKQDASCSLVDITFVVT